MQLLRELTSELARSVEQSNAHVSARGHAIGA